MKRWSSRVGLVLGVAAIGVACFVASASARTTAKKPIVIGWAFDSKGSMAPFDNPALALQFDVWHLWNTETIFDDIAAQIHRFAGVHVCDRRNPTRGWADRALPGEGVGGLPRILQALDAAGWDGLYDIEIFSDDGTFGAEYPDSFWAAPAVETLARARAAFEHCWSGPPSAASRRQTVKEWK
jgi:hypothetical protein